MDRYDESTGTPRGFTQSEKKASSMNEELKTEPMQAGDEAMGFTCGEQTLDRYFANHALANAQLGVGKTY